MLYVLSIDWLSLFCMYMGDGDMWQPADLPNFSYKLETFGTRSFSRFHRIRIANPEGGWDEFAEVQSVPYSAILPPYAIIIRFVNRQLYAPDFWECADNWLIANQIKVQGISRIDICADFNDFATCSPLSLIEGFAAKRLRHIGRGVGSLAFNHEVKHGEYGVHYTGLTFGTHASDAHVYLYNKTFELLTQGDKPWIRERWKRVGLNVQSVWRLEVSIKSAGLKFKDKATKQLIQVDAPMVAELDSLDKIYHTFVKKLFSFVKNRPGIKNISREPRIKLFEDVPAYDRGAICNLSSGDRMTRILIRALWQMSDRYRGGFVYKARETSRDLAGRIAASTGLYQWMEEHQAEWNDQIHK